MVEYQAGQAVVVAFSPDGEALAREQVVKAGQAGATAEAIKLADLTSSPVKAVSKVSPLHQIDDGGSKWGSSGGTWEGTLG